MTRYYKNNFTDGFRQDAIDMFLGNFKVKQEEGNTLPCPLSKQKDWRYMVLPLMFLGSIAMFFFSLFIPTEHSTETFVYLLFWLGMISISLLVVLYYGTEYVDFPKLTDIRPRRRERID